MKVLFFTDIHWGYSDKGNQKWVSYLENLKKEHPDATVILGGDNGSNEIHHEIKCLSKVREIFSDNEIYYLMGNHSYWNNQGDGDTIWIDGEMRVLNGAMNIHFAILDAAKKFNIKYLPDNPIVDREKKVVITGVSGWYETKQFFTNDCNHIPFFNDSDEWLRRNCYEEFNTTLNLHEGWKKEGYKTIMASHFHFHREIFDWKAGDSQWFGANRVYTDHMKFTDENWYGHTHRAFDQVLDGVRYVNTGTDYAKPSHLFRKF